MSQRSAARERKRQEAEREAEQDEHAGHHTHLIGTTVECSCGADFGVTCVAYPEEWWTMTPTQQTVWEEYGKSVGHTHLIGTTVECSCGADFGVTCVAYPEEWWTMTPTQQTVWEESLTCRICGKRGMVTTSPTPG